MIVYAPIITYKYAGAKLKRASTEGLLPGFFPSRKGLVMSVKGTECRELCGVMYVKPVVLNHMQGESGASLYSVHASQKVGLRDVLDCDYKVIAQIVNMYPVPGFEIVGKDEKGRRRK